MTQQAAKVAQPIAPRLSKQLNEYNKPSEFELELEIDTCLVQELDTTQLSKLSIEGSKIAGAIMTGMVAEVFTCSDTMLIKLEAAGLQAYKANLLRVQLNDCRFTGVEFAEGQFEDCSFKNVKLNEAGFRFTSFKRVCFENCVLTNADFSNAKFIDVTFVGCSLEGTNFISASCKRVDLTSENLTVSKGILGLSGSTISGTQLVQLAPLFAAELGFHVENES